MGVIKLNENDIHRIVKRVIENNNINIVNLSDLHNARTWSPNVLTRAKEGRGIYVYEDGEFRKRDREPEERGRYTHGSKPKQVYYLTSEEVNKLNSLVNEAKSLEKKAKELREEIKKITKGKVKF